MTNIEFNNLVYTASRSLKYPASKITHDPSTAEELVRNTLQNALKSRHKFVEGTNIKAWLFLIMKNTYDDRIQNSGDQQLGVAEINSRKNSLEGGEEISRSINTLDKIFREPFVMHFSGFKFNEIAEKLRLPLETVKNRIHVARKILQCQLAGAAL